MARPLIGYRTPRDRDHHARCWRAGCAPSQIQRIGACPLARSPCCPARRLPSVCVHWVSPPNGEATPWSDAAAVEAGLLCAATGRAPSFGPAIKLTYLCPSNQCSSERLSLWQKRRLQGAALHHGPRSVRSTYQRGAGRRPCPCPGWTSYKHRLHYQTFDVTHLVRDGQNAIGAQVAEGWFCGRLGFLGGVQNIWGDNIGLMAQLHIDFADGTRIYHTILTPAGRQAPEPS